MGINAAKIVEDLVLERLDERARAQERLAAQTGLFGERSGLDLPTADKLDLADADTTPYDLEPEAPRALSLEKLLELSQTQMPAEIAASTGDFEALVVLHGLTPFHRQGSRVREIWGMGYSAIPRDCDEARTVSFQPTDSAIKAIEVNQKLALDLDLQGRMELGIPGEGAQLVTAGIAGGASTRQGFAVSLSLEWSAVEIQAGPFGSGGVRWNLYRQGSRIDRHHRLVQTLLVPRGTRRLTFDVNTWVRRRGLLGGLLKVGHWQSPPRQFMVNVEVVHR